MNGLSVGAWEDQLDPGRLRIDLVEAFKASILDNAIRKRKTLQPPGDTERDGGLVGESQCKRLKIGEEAPCM
jgi:hypothetical protein